MRRNLLLVIVTIYFGPSWVSSKLVALQLAALTKIFEEGGIIGSMPQGDPCEDVNGQWTDYVICDRNEQLLQLRLDGPPDSDSLGTITQLSKEVSNLLSLTRLELGGNAISDLPPELASLTELDRLNLNGNTISVLPIDVGSLSNLRSLSLQDNLLKQLPNELTGLTSLTALFVSGNRFEAIPAVLLSDQLQSLTGGDFYPQSDGVDTVCPEKDLLNIKVDDMCRNCTAEDRCNSQGECIELVNDWRCECFSGWEGDSCADDIDECLAKPCKNGGVCRTPKFDKFTCTCPDGFTGKTCRETDECASSPCLNGSTCSDVIGNDYTCACLEGFTGKQCDLLADPCSTSPCLNGSTCINSGPGNFSCSCANGYTGDKCDEDLDECLGDPCSNGGTCTTPIFGDFSCDCTDTWKGKLCDEEKRPCELQNPCKNSGICIDILNGTDYQCDCNGGYSGDLCEIAGSHCVTEVDCFCDDEWCVIETNDTATVGDGETKVGTAKIKTEYPLETTDESILVFHVNDSTIHGLIVSEGCIDIAEGTTLHVYLTDDLEKETKVIFLESEADCLTMKDYDTVLFNKEGDTISLDCVQEKVADDTYFITFPKEAGTLIESCKSSPISSDDDDDLFWVIILVIVVLATCCIVLAVIMAIVLYKTYMNQEIDDENQGEGNYDHQDVDSDNYGDNKQKTQGSPRDFTEGTNTWRSGDNDSTFSSSEQFNDMMDRNGNSDSIEMSSIPDGEADEITTTVTKMTRTVTVSKPNQG